MTVCRGGGASARVLHGLQQPLGGLIFFLIASDE
jgi:hypothetical protein